MVTSVLLYIAVDGKQQFHEVVLEDDERKNLMQLINRGLLTPNKKSLPVLPDTMVRLRRKKDAAS